MENNTWVPMVLKDVEAYCHQNELQEIAVQLEEVRLKFKKLQRGKKLGVEAKKFDLRQIKLVWSQDAPPEEETKELLAKRR